MFTQLKDLKNETTPVFKKFALNFIEQITLFHHVTRNIETMMIKEKPMQDQYLHKIFCTVFLFKLVC